MASGCSIASHRADWLQLVLEAVISNVVAKSAAVSDRRAVVDATPHPRIFDLLTHLRQALIGPWPNSGRERRGLP
jgi:hypothetical protein